MATPSHQDLANQLFGGGATQSMGALQAVKEAVLAIAPGLKDAGAEIKAELKQMGTQGAHEMAAALFNGSAFVMYPRGGRDDHGIHGPEPSHEQQQDGQELPVHQMERGGRSL